MIMADAAHERSSEAEIATSTLAEIYVQQGLVDRALVIYRRLAQRSPGDARIATRVTELETELERQRAGGEREAFREPPDLEAPPPSTFEPGRLTPAEPEPAPAEPEPAPEEPEQAPEEPEHTAAPATAPRSAPAAAADRQFLAWLEKR
jgi:hypothetical protein